MRNPSVVICAPAYHLARAAAKKLGVRNYTVVLSIQRLRMIPQTMELYEVMNTGILLPAWFALRGELRRMATFGWTVMPVTLP